jgi:uncharacterized membrane protein SirB2
LPHKPERTVNGAAIGPVWRGATQGRLWPNAHARCQASAWRLPQACRTTLDMSVASWYPQIRLVHMGLVAGSGLLFAVRGAAVLAGQGWAMRRPWRWLSYCIDTLLLCAGVTLWAILSLNPVDSPWLGTKLLLLVLYVVLGSLALKRARSPLSRRMSLAAALGVYLFMASVAVAHHPLGILHPLARQDA